MLTVQGAVQVYAAQHMTDNGGSLREMQNNTFNPNAYLQQGITTQETRASISTPVENQQQSVSVTNKLKIYSITQLQKERMLELTLEIFCKHKVAFEKPKLYTTDNKAASKYKIISDCLLKTVNQSDDDAIALAKRLDSIWNSCEVLHENKTRDGKASTMEALLRGWNTDELRPQLLGDDETIINRLKEIKDTSKQKSAINNASRK